MASYYKLSADTPNGMVQNDDSRDKKVIYNFQFHFQNDKEAVEGNAINTITSFISLPLNSEWFTLKNLVVKELIHYSGNENVVNPAVEFYKGRHNMVSLSPVMHEEMYIGFSDRIIDGTSPYFSQNLMFFPISFLTESTINEHNLLMRDKFHLRKNVNYINVYIKLTTVDTGNVDAFWNLLESDLGITSGNAAAVHYRYNVIVYGVKNVDLAKRKKPKVKSYSSYPANRDR